MGLPLRKEALVFRLLLVSIDADLHAESGLAPAAS